MFSVIQAKNPNLNIHAHTAPGFQRYGRIVEEYDFTPYIEYLLSSTEVPQEGNAYVADINTLHGLPLFHDLETAFYGGMNAEIGYCNGNGTSLNALEYHKGSEIDVAATDCILMLGCITDIVNGRIDTSKVDLFFIPKGAAVELYSTTLHFAPCSVSPDGFKTGIVLPKDTNLPLDTLDKREPLLWKKNKWLIAHPDSPSARQGAFIGITGENLKISY